VSVENATTQLERSRPQHRGTLQLQPSDHSTEVGNSHGVCPSTPSRLDMRNSWVRTVGEPLNHHACARYEAKGNMDHWVPIDRPSITGIIALRYQWHARRDSNSQPSYPWIPKRSPQPSTRIHSHWLPARVLANVGRSRQRAKPPRHPPGHATAQRRERSGRGREDNNSKRPGPRSPYSAQPLNP
jgi:hypothetical protein